MSVLSSTVVRAELPRGAETILLVDDFAVLIQMTKAFLERQGYTVYTALNGVEALKVLARDGSHINLVFTDVVMPLMGGPELAKQMKDLYPRVKVLFASGYGEEVLAEYGMAPGLGQFIAKPYDFASLSEHIRNALDATPPMPS